MHNTTAKQNHRLEITDALSKLRATHKNWVRLQKMTEDKLYKLMGGSLALCYLVAGSDAHMAAFKELCNFKWGRKTKTSVLVAKAVFGADAKQVHAYAKALEIAISEKVTAADMSAWLRVNGGISGVTRGDGVGTDGKSKSNVIDLERRHTINVGRNVADYQVKPKYIIPVSEKLVASLAAPDVLLLCQVNYSKCELSVYWQDVDDDVIDNYYEQVGKAVKETDAYAKKEYEVFAAKKAKEAAAKYEIGDMLNDMNDELDDGDELEDAA